MQTADDLPDEMIYTIFEASSGNSFWCTEIASFIMERGQEEFMKNNKGKDAASALSTLIICRLEKLSTEQQVVVKHAAVMGEEFTTELLASTLPHRILRNIEESLTVITEHNFLSLTCEDPPTFLFPNQVIRNILYDLTPPRERSNIHRNLAEQVEGLHAHNLVPYYFM